MSVDDSRRRVFEWLEGEATHIDAKWNRADDDAFMEEEAAFDEDSYWGGWLEQYRHRAHLLGIETPLGRQAAMKYVATAVEMAASMIRVWGSPPPPGLPSGMDAEEAAS